METKFYKYCPWKHNSKSNVDGNQILQALSIESKCLPPLFYPLSLSGSWATETILHPICMQTMIPSYMLNQPMKHTICKRSFSRPNLKVNLSSHMTRSWISKHVLILVLNAVSIFHNPSFLRTIFYLNRAVVHFYRIKHVGSVCHCTMYCLFRVKVQVSWLEFRREDTCTWCGKRCNI